MKVYAGANRPGAFDGLETGAEGSTGALSNEGITSSKKSRSVQLYVVLIMLCTGRAVDRIASGVPWQQNSAETAVDRVVSAPCG